MSGDYNRISIVEGWVGGLWIRIVGLAIVFQFVSLLKGVLECFHVSFCKIFNFPFC